MSAILLEKVKKRGCATLLHVKIVVYFLGRMPEVILSFLHQLLSLKNHFWYSELVQGRNKGAGLPL